MTRIDWLVFRRVLARVILTMVLFFALLALVESLNTSKFRMLSSFGGPLLAVAGIVLSALRSSIGVLPVSVLIGTIAGVLDMQARREFTIIQATGHSVWRVARTPLLAALLLASAASIGGESLLILGNRLMPGAPINNESSQAWLEQNGSDGHYLIEADRLTGSPPALSGVTVFLTDTPERDRIEADTAELKSGHWLFKTGMRYALDKAVEPLTNFKLATRTTAGDLSLRASGARDLTLPELIKAATSALSDSDYRAVALTSLFRTFTLPLMVVGGMLLGFAVAAGYRRKLQYGNTVLFGIVMGFALFTVNEMAVRAGNADVLPPLAAALGPGFVSIIVGVTALLYSQDGKMWR
jgi:lipopolysaccharide export system permease protein